MASYVDHRRQGRQVADYFLNNPDISFVGFAGIGRHGGALILEEKKGDQSSRKLIVKYSLGDLPTDISSDADQQLRNEYRWLQMLQGAEHIVQLIPFADCSMNLPGISNGERTVEQTLEDLIIRDQVQAERGETSVNRGKIAKEPSRGRKCPTFALEYLPNGTLFLLSEKLVLTGDTIPNRILWKIWLCMVRQCVAMAFPPNRAPEVYNGQMKREQIYPDREQFPLTQNSSHLENFLFGLAPAQAPDADHGPCVPVTKLIDFGRGRIENIAAYEQDLRNAYECGSKINLWGAAHALMMVILVHLNEELLDMEEVPVIYQYTEKAQIQQILTKAPHALRETTIIDVRLRDRLVRCLASNLNNCPSLEEALNEAETQVANRDSINISESDDSITRFVEKFFYDATIRVPIS
ncbi:hypothetical protein GGR51DRAFT_571160 [Nemania sp. FL0031]|nr:hypothetical protein GGR51DRAFT_571160 [Nemania sp. FL0031]